MANITNCLACGGAYEETSSEEANSPHRRCLACWDAERKRLGPPDIICKANPSRERCAACGLWFRDDLHMMQHQCHVGTKGGK